MSRRVLAEWARLRNIEDIAAELVRGWRVGFPAETEHSANDVIDRLERAIGDGPDDQAFAAHTPDTTEARVMAGPMPGSPCDTHRKQGFIYSVIGCPRCYPATPDTTATLRAARFWRHSSQCAWERGGKDSDCSCGLGTFRAALQQPAVQPEGGPE